MQNNLYRQSMPSPLKAKPLGIVLNFVAVKSAPADSHDGAVKSVPADSHDGAAAIAAAWLVLYLVILGSLLFSSVTDIAAFY